MCWLLCVNEASLLHTKSVFKETKRVYTFLSFKFSGIRFRNSNSSSFVGFLFICVCNGFACSWHSQLQSHETFFFFLYSYEHLSIWALNIYVLHSLSVFAFVQEFTFYFSILLCWCSCCCHKNERTHIFRVVVYFIHFLRGMVWER